MTNVEAHQPRLGGAVVRLSEVAAQPGAGDDVDDAAVAVLAHDRQRVPAAVEAAVEVDLQHGVEILGRHVDELLVAQDPGVVHQDIAAPEGIDRGLDDVAGRLELGDAVVVGRGLAAEGLDLLAHDGGGIRVGAATIGAAAHVVDDHAGAFLRQRQRDTAPDAPSRTGDDGDLALQQLAHLVDSSGRSVRTRAGGGVTEAAG